VGVGDGAGHVFVNIQDRSELVVIDQAANTVQARWPLAPCTNPTGLALDVLHRRLFAVCDNHKMVILDARSGRQVAILPIGGAPDGAEYDPALGTAFSSNGYGTLTLIHEDDPEHFSLAANVPTQERARWPWIPAPIEYIWSQRRSERRPPRASSNPNHGQRCFQTASLSSSLHRGEVSRPVVAYSGEAGAPFRGLTFMSDFCEVVWREIISS
jgi:hypothetical protein